jgi:cyclase
MLRPRIIPCLLIHENGLVKTTQFKDPKYVGDPINAVKIFNEKEVDELIVIDIDATKNNNDPNYKLIEKLAYECRMPLCYGGGIKTSEQAKRILNLGVEKIAISSIALSNPDIVKDISEQIGSQSVVVVLDIKKKLFGGYDVVTHNASKKANVDISDFIKLIQNKGIGELVLNSVDNDGKMTGYDLDPVEKYKNLIHTPLTILGGAGSLDDIKKLISKYKVIGAAAGSLFVFKGKYRAVLISYPAPAEKKLLTWA